MGLDSVELVIATEETFGVTITDAEAAACSTPRGLIDLVCAKLTVVNDNTCHSQRSFYLLRNALISTFGVSRRSVKPTTPIRAIIPPANHRISWPLLNEAIHARILPPLRRPAWLLRIIGGVAFSAMVAVFIAAQLRGVNSATLTLGFLAGVTAAILVAWLACICTRSWCNRIPGYEGLVKDLIPYVQTSNDLKFTREAVAQIVRAITIEQLGIDESIYTEDSRFIEDLGMQ